MPVAMSDNESEKDLMLELYAVSNFGDIDAVLTDLHGLKSRSPPTNPSTSIRGQLRSRGNRIIPQNDGDRPSLMGRGRGVAFEAFQGVIDGAESRHGLSRDLMEIGSANYRNESIEAYIDDGQIRRQNEDSSMSNFDEDESLVDATEVIEAAFLSGTVCPPSSSPSPAKKLPPVVKAKKSKKKRNVVLRSFLAKMTEFAKNDDGIAKPAVNGESISKATVKFAADEDANSDVYDLNGNIEFLSMGDSFTSSEIELSQESYLLDDGQASSVGDGQASLVNDSQTSDDLQANVEAFTDLSTSLSSKSSSDRKKNNSRSSSKSTKSYHGTSRRKKIMAPSPLPSQNPVLGRRSPVSDVYVPKIVNTTFSYNKKDFPPL